MKPYEQLTVGGQFRRFRPAALDACRQFGVEVARLSPLNHGENTTFRVTSSSSQEFVVRIHRLDYQTRETISSELEFLDALRNATDLVAPRPVRNREGEFISRVRANGVEGERNAVLFEWVDGRFVGEEASPHHFQQLGEATAILHNFSEKYNPPANFKRQDWRGAFQAKSLREKIGQFAKPEPFLESLEIANRKIAEYGTEKDCGLIHADLHFGNVLFKNGRARVIDFDDLAWGHHAMDYAVSFTWHRNSKSFDSYLEGYRRGYESRRKLPEDWLERLEVFIALRRLFITDWLFTRDDNPRLREYRDEALPKWEKELERFVATGSVRGN